MLRKPCITLSLVIAVCMFFVIIDGMAQTASLPQTCTAGSYTISVDNNYFGVLVYGINDPLFSLFPCYKLTGGPCDFPYYVYQYNVSPTSNISAIDQVIPLCDDPIQVLAASPNNSQLLPAGQYDSGTKWPANGLYDSVVLKWAANPSAGKMWIATNASTTTLTAMALKSGNSLSYCSNPNYDQSKPITAMNPLGGIAGPGCVVCNTGSAYRADTRQVIFDSLPFRIRVTWDEGSPVCEGTVEYSTDGGATYQYATLATTAPTINGKPILQSGSVFGNERCEASIITFEGSTGKWVVINGRWYYIISP